ncbi:hypothetical protein NDU88_003651 [Pleurodeles waltl]|uniref:Uncharacterized protein n=1 Tax=Pleurodeles waltl TaxID=8319 RepID=A0AAV7MW80_PLEWA|nr:hypothetical protein NDU88_003651 [Pleurodeles waltl]
MLSHLDTTGCSLPRNGMLLSILMYAATDLGAVLYKCFLRTTTNNLPGASISSKHQADREKINFLKNTWQSLHKEVSPELHRTP